MKTLAMVGCGDIGNYHLGHILQFEDVKPVGFCDLIEERAQAFAAQTPSAKAYTDFLRMYDETKPDMVFVCVPPYARGAIELEAIARGIHLFIEKPMALDLDLAKEIRDTAQKAGIITAIGFQCRYSNIIAPSRAFIQSHDIQYVNCNRIGGSVSKDWWKDRSLSGGQIVEQTIHQFDIIRFLHDEPVEVFTFGAMALPGDVPQTKSELLSTTAIRYKGGSLGMLGTGSYATGSACFDSKVTFSSRNARLDHHIISKALVYEPFVEKAASGLVVKNDGTMSSNNGEPTVYKDDGQAGITCDRTFIDAVITCDTSKILSPFADAMKSLQFTMACNESMDTGKPVTVVFD